MRPRPPPSWARLMGRPPSPGALESAPGTPQPVQENVPACVFAASPFLVLNRRGLPRSLPAQDPETITEPSAAVWRNWVPKTLVLSGLFFGKEALQGGLPARQCRKAGCRPPAAAECAVRRPPCGPAGLLRGDRLDGHPPSDDGAGELEAAAGAGIDHVEKSARTRSLNQPGDRFGEVAGGGGTPNLVGDHPDWPAPLRRGEDGLDEVLALPSVQPCGTDHAGRGARRPHPLLSLVFRSGVHTQGIRLVVLRVARALGPIAAVV